jgi:hypothetical protein
LSGGTRRTTRAIRIAPDAPERFARSASPALRRRSSVAHQRNVDALYGCPSANSSGRLPLAFHG